MTDKSQIGDGIALTGISHPVTIDINKLDKMSKFLDNFNEINGRLYAKFNFVDEFGDSWDENQECRIALSEGTCNTAYGYSVLPPIKSGEQNVMIGKFTDEEKKELGK